MQESTSRPPLLAPLMPSRSGVAVGDQPLGCADEIVERVLLVGEPAAVMPSLTKLAAAANDGRRINPAEPDPRRDDGVVAGPDRNAEAAVSVEQRAVGAVERNIRSMHERH